MKDRTLSVLDVRMDDCTAKDAMKAVTEFLRTDPVNTVELLSADTVMQAAGAEGLKNGLEELDLVLAGDEHVLEAAEVTECRKLQETRNQTFLRMVFYYFRRQHTRLFLLMDTEKEAAEAESYFREHYSGIPLAGSAAVPADESMDDWILNLINGAQADCVLSGLSSPKQEDFIVRVRDLLDIRLWLGIGNDGKLLPREETFMERLQGFLGRRVLKHEAERSRRES